MEYIWTLYSESSQRFWECTVYTARCNCLGTWTLRVIRSPIQRNTPLSKKPIQFKDCSLNKGFWKPWVAALHIREPMEGRLDRDAWFYVCTPGRFQHLNMEYLAQTRLNILPTKKPRSSLCCCLDPCHCVVAWTLKDHESTWLFL